MTTDIDTAIAKLEGLEAKATPGPWKTNAHLKPRGSALVEGDGLMMVMNAERMPDATLIVALRNEALPLLRAARDQLRTAEERAAWQPIETAPKDGTRVLLWITRDDHEVAPREAARDGSFYAPDQTWVSHGDYVMATHWQPLPAPPALSETT